MATDASLARPAEVVTPVDVDETVPLSFDYSDMAPGDSIAGTPALTCEAVVGDDASASSRLSGTPQVAGLVVQQTVTGMVNAVTYLVRCKAAMASGQVLTQAMLVSCIKVGA